MTLPWYPRDMGKYARDTKHLTMLEHGAYNLLLDCYYSTGALPMLEHCSSNAELMPDHSRMYRVCSAMTKLEQDAVDVVLKMFFNLDKKGFYRHRKADEVIAEQTEKHTNRVKAGKAKGKEKGNSNAPAMLKQCSSNTPQTKTKKKTKNKTPPLPPSRGNGVFHSENGEEKDFRIDDHLTDDARLHARKKAPGWDQQNLMKVYDQGIEDGKRERPKHPNAAFPVWCGKYTEGRKP